MRQPAPLLLAASPPKKLFAIRATYNKDKQPTEVKHKMFGTQDLILIGVIVVVLFGATKLPQLGSGIGQAIWIKKP